jgi:D-alanyl-D-alanine carboxypeptidase
MQRNSTSHLFFSFIGLLFIFTLISCSSSSSASAKASRNAAGTERYAALIVDANTGTVLHQENAGKLRYPASLTKMMTLYLAFEALDKGRITMDQMLTVSSFAASRPRMNMGLRSGEKISVRDAILSLIVRSANDTAVVLAEAIGGNEPIFARNMTMRAQSLGMANTVFRNASGLPDNSQRTTAFDLARLAIALRRDYPQYYSLFSRTNFTYKGHVWEGHNRLTSNYPGADGLKTGFVNASGFNLVTSAKRGNAKLVGVVMGGETAKARDRRMVKLLDYYFQKITGQVMNTAYAAEPVSATPVSTRKKHKRHGSKKLRAANQQASLR